MWDLLRAYKTDHTKSTLPEQTNDNSSKDERIWTLGTLTFDPLVWHRYQYAWGHHMFRHTESPFNEKEALSTKLSATRIAHEIANPTHPINPLLESPIHKKEVMDEMQRLTPDKSPGPDGVTKRMLRAGGEKFNTILHDVIATLWEHQAQPSEWQKSLMQPIYKGGKKPNPDPASYRGIFLSSALAKLFEGIIIKRLTQYTEQHSTLTDNQLGTRSNRQIHDDIYSIIAIIQHNFFAKGQPTYVAFLDFATAFPYVFRKGLLSTMHERNIVGKMWHALRLRFNIVKFRVLHPKIRQSSEVEILRGLPEGSSLSPSLFGIVVADLIHELQRRFPNATITHSGNSVWIGGILYVDDLCLISFTAQELQEMIHVC